MKQPKKIYHKVLYTLNVGEGPLTPTQSMITQAPDYDWTIQAISTTFVDDGLYVHLLVVWERTIYLDISDIPGL